MVIYRLESTSTTSCTSNEESLDLTEVDAHIGDIDEALPSLSCQPRNGTDADIVSVVSRDSAASKVNSSSDEVSVASSIDVISYDSSMERIRKEVWDKVREAKRKRLHEKNAFKEKIRSEFEFGSLSSWQEEMTGCKHDGRAPAVLVNRKDEESSLGDAERIPLSHSRAASQPTLVSFVKHPLLATDHSSAGKPICEVTRANQRSLVAGQYIPVASDSADPSANQAVEEKAVIQDFQDETIDATFELILAIQLDETKPEEHHDSQPHRRRSTLEPAVRVRVFGRTENTVLFVPLSLVERRENEMFQRAYHRGTRLDEWSGSLLSRKLQTLYPYRTEHPQSIFTFDLHPESELADASCSQSFLWQGWINQCIESFYKTGRMRIPDFCDGSDLLTALEYFGILYDTDALVFDSFATYLRVKLWSEYFSHRDAIAAFIRGKLEEAPCTTTRIFATYPQIIDKEFYIAIGTLHAELLDGGISLDPKQTTRSSSRLVHGFFNESTMQTGTSTSVDSLIREDFCNYLRRFVPGANSSFPKKLATIHFADGSSEELELATLFIQMEDPSLCHGDYSLASHHEDESELSSEVSASYGRTQPSLLDCRFLDNSAPSRIRFSDATSFLDQPCSVTHEIKALYEDLEASAHRHCHNNTDELRSNHANAQLSVDPPFNVSHEKKAKCREFDMLKHTRCCRAVQSNAEIPSGPLCNVPKGIMTLCEDLELPVPSQYHSAKAKYHAPDPPPSRQFNVPISVEHASQDQSPSLDYYNRNKTANNNLPDCQKIALAPALPTCKESSFSETTSSDNESKIYELASSRLPDEAFESKYKSRQSNPTARWNPIASLDCVSESPCLKLEESDILDIRMPWNLAERATVAIATPSIVCHSDTSIQHLQPFPSLASGSQSVTSHRSVSMKVDHIYEDLMLENTDFFFDGLEKPKTEVAQALSRNVRVFAAPENKRSKAVQDRYEDGEREQKVHFHVNKTILRYHPSDFVWDFVTVVDGDTNDGFSEGTSKVAGASN